VDKKTTKYLQNRYGIKESDCHEISFWEVIEPMVNTDISELNKTIRDWDATAEQVASAISLKAELSIIKRTVEGE